MDDAEIFLQILTAYNRLSRFKEADAERDLEKTVYRTQFSTESSFAWINYQMRISRAYVSLEASASFWHFHPNEGIYYDERRFIINENTDNRMFKWIKNLHGRVDREAVIVANRYAKQADLQGREPNE